MSEMCNWRASLLAVEDWTASRSPGIAALTFSELRIACGLVAFPAGNLVVDGLSGLLRANAALQIAHWSSALNKDKVLRQPDGHISAGKLMMAQCHLTLAGDLKAFITSGLPEML